ncbi:MAG: Gfo/Idh/MocA family oxidoreductase [Bacteroidota bacterium]|nr:Gfo/Idh/MocA family oxidoreductase [Bacteroidota bacterium]
MTKIKFKRRNFIRTAAAGVAGISLFRKSMGSVSQDVRKGLRVGIIGLDTSHSVAFTQTLNSPSPGPEYGGYKIVAAYPKGSNDIKSSVDRIPGYTEDVKKLGVEIVASIEELIEKTDVVLLETNDGRLHLEQALKVMKAGKRMFIDKPIAASLADAIAIFDAAEHYNVPVFSSSSLRYIQGIDEIRAGSAGNILGAYTFSPATLEKTHPDLFWYGVHGVETLFTIMGTGCKSVSGTFTADTDLVTGLWSDSRIGTFRGIRKGKADYGGTVFGEKGIVPLGKYNGYNPLLAEIVKFFQTGVPPVKREETIEIFAFMTAAAESKRQNGSTVLIEKVMKEATREAGRKMNTLL